MKNVHFGRGLALALPILALCAMIVSGCASERSGDVSSTGPALPPMTPKRTDDVTADLAMRVPDVEKSQTEIGRILHTAGGYIESANSQTLAERYPTMSLTLKIPVTKVETAMESLKSLGRPTGMSFRMQDVTDSEGGISSGPAKIPLSTVNLNLEQSVAIDVSQDPQWLDQAWDNARSNASVVYRTLFVGVIWLATFLPLWLPALLAYVYYKRRLRRPPLIA